MASAATVILSVCATLSIQGVYFVFVKYPGLLMQKILDMNLFHVSEMGVVEDETSLLRRIGNAAELYHRAHPMQKGLDKSLRQELVSACAQLRGERLASLENNSHIPYAIEVEAAIDRLLAIPENKDDSERQYRMWVDAAVLSAGLVRMEQNANRRKTMYFLQINSKQADIDTIFRTYVIATAWLRILLSIIVFLSFYLLRVHHFLTRNIWWGMPFFCSLLLLWVLQKLLDRDSKPITKKIKELHKSDA